MPPRRGEARAGAPRRGPGAGRSRFSRAALLFVAALFLVVWPAARKAVALWETVPARYGRVTVAVATEVLVVREERVVLAPVTGRLIPVAREGERVPRGAPLARLLPPSEGDDRRGLLDRQLAETKRRAILDEQSPLSASMGGGEGASSRALTANRQALEEERQALDATDPSGGQLVRSVVAGTVSYTVDGLEGMLSRRALPELLKGATPVGEVARGAEPRVVEARAEVAAGQPVAKVVDNFAVWLVAELPLPGNGGARLPEPGERLRLRFRGVGAPESATCTGLVVSRRDGRKTSRLVVAPVEYWPEFGRLRRAEVELRFGEYEGVVVPRTAVVKRGETTGVIVESWLGRMFQRVVARGGDRDRVVVDGLAPGTRVWRSPE